MTTIIYRKTGKGEWVAFGPVSAITAGTTVTVTKRSGETKAEHIASVGKPFTVGGQQMVYGYLAPAAPRSTSGGRRARAGSYYRPRSRACLTGGNCSSFGDGRSCGADDCDGW